jgi:hypothetical protein
MAKIRMLKKKDPAIQQEFGITASLEQAQAKASNSDKKKGGKTRITIKYDVGFNNQLSIRGKGGNLSWDKGIPLKNIKADEWVWETSQLFSELYFKVLINDKQYEAGDNHQATCGSLVSYTPQFYL